MPIVKITKAAQQAMISTVSPGERVEAPVFHHKDGDVSIRLSDRNLEWLNEIRHPTETISETIIRLSHEWHKRRRA